jgi:hypothetical protein
MRIFAPALCASLALFSGSALAAPTAAPTGVAADARCLLAMAALSGSKDPKQSESAQAGMVYYAGRIRAREPSFDFSTRLKAVAMTTSLRDLDNGLKTLSQAPAGAAKPGAAAPPKP